MKETVGTKRQSLLLYKQSENEKSEHYVGRHCLFQLLLQA